jgi:hypothetical protein
MYCLISLNHCMNPLALFRRLRRMHVSTQSLLLAQQAPVGPAPLPRPQYPEVHVEVATNSVTLDTVVVLLCIVT